MKKIFYSVLVALFILSCQKNENNLQNSVEEKTDFIPLKEALIALEAQYQILFGDITTRGKQLINISSIQPIGKNNLGTLTKSDESIIPDTLMYLVNFSKNNGFAILSASKKLGEDIYCITDNGKITDEDFRNAYDFMRTKLSHTTKSSDSQDFEFNEMGPDIVPALILSSMMNDLIYGRRKLETKINSNDTKYGPYIKTKWSNTNKAPFNSYIPNNMYPGCVAIATSQIMLYNRRPATPYVFDGKTCNWTTMETVANYKNYSYYGTPEAMEQVGHFIYEIGKPHNCFVRYSKGSWAVADGAQRTLKNYGYKDVNKVTGFGKSHQKKASAKIINQHLPVYLGGCVSGTTSDGHAWILDGECGDYYHINWGWNGVSDGYFKKGVFNTTDRDSMDQVYDKNHNTQQGNYTWTYRMITYNL